MQEAKQKELTKLRSEHNFKRSNTLSALKRKNLDMSKQITSFLKNNKDLNDLQYDSLLSVQKSLNMCSNHTIYGESSENKGEMVHFGAIDHCGRKTCFICNWNRQKTIRRKYALWFKENSFLIRIDRKKNRRFETKVVTFNQLQKYVEKGWNILDDKVGYDLMHLTLTVPHYSNGFQGEKYYFTKIQDLYKELRKNKLWNENIYGGEYGIEATNQIEKGNGYNIHIHSLIFVKKFTQNRNYLHKEILKLWNSLTVNEDSKREKLTSFDIEKIKKGNSSFTNDEILNLNPKGATILGLENIYTIGLNGEKIRKTEKALMKAIMETISYHFEPLFFDKKDKKTFDIEAYADVLPAIKFKPMYEKFGILRGEQSLNINESQDIKEQIKEAYREAKHVLIDEETGEVSKPIRYVVINPAYVYHNPENQSIHISKTGMNKKQIYDCSFFRVVDIIAASLRHKNKGKLSHERPSPIKRL